MLIIFSFIDLTGIYNARMHPDVRSGKKTENQIFQEFLSTFEAYSDIQVNSL